MTIYPPKKIHSSEGLGLNTAKSITPVSDSVSISREIWGEMGEPWREGSVVIADTGYVWTTKWEVGEPYIVTKFHDTDGRLVGVYCDVSRPIEASEGGFSFEDLYLDVWQAPGGDPVVLDEDELIQATEAGYISVEEASGARRVAARIALRLAEDPEFIDF